MYQNARKQEILSILNKRTYATVSALSKELHASPSSIRRDLTQMETEGLVVRSYGGVELPNAQKHFVPFSSRRHQRSDIKRLMAEKAVTFIESGDVIFLDDSSSAYFVAEKLIGMKDITVVTSSIDVLCLLSQSDIKTYSVGGLIDPENRTCLVGNYAAEMIRSIRADWCIFSVKSLDADGTLSDCVEEGVAVLKNMLAVSKKAMFLCDNSKLGTRSMFVQCMIEDLDVVISDSDLPDFLNTKPEKTQFIQSTSGTTGKRVVAFYTQNDIDLWEDCCARAITAVGGTNEDVCQVCYGYGLFTGGPGLNGGSHRVGCLTLPMSSGNTDRQIQFMMDLGATILCCTPSYAAYIGESLKEAGYKPEDNKLKAGIFGAEPWTEEMRRDIENSLGIKAYDIYGLTETSGPGVSFECEEQTGMHINEDHFIAEIIDPDTGEVLPDGSKGELVFTAITKEAFPLLRYRTRDICVLSREKCSCGRTFVKMSKPMGRSDDMMIIRGVNVFPSQIETVLLKEGYSPNYQIVVDRQNNNDTLDVNVELTPEMFSDTVKSVTDREKKLASAIQTMLGIKPIVHLVPPKTITRSEGKAVRVIDKRKLI